MMSLVLHKSEVELDEGTHKDFVMVRQATGEYKYTPINGTVVRGKGNNHFEHVDPQTGEKIGWYRIDATAGARSRSHAARRVLFNT